MCQKLRAVLSIHVKKIVFLLKLEYKKNMLENAQLKTHFVLKNAHSPGGSVL